MQAGGHKSSNLVQLNEITSLVVIMDCSLYYVPSEYFLLLLNTVYFPPPPRGHRPTPVVDLYKQDTFLAV